MKTSPTHAPAEQTLHSTLNPQIIAPPTDHIIVTIPAITPAQQAEEVSELRFMRLSHTLTAAAYGAASLGLFVTAGQATYSALSTPASHQPDTTVSTMPPSVEITFCFLMAAGVAWAASMMREQARLDTRNLNKAHLRSPQP